MCCFLGLFPFIKCSRIQSDIILNWGILKEYEDLSSGKYRFEALKLLKSLIDQTD